MKFKIKKLGIKEGTSTKTGKPYKLVTILTESGEKLKTFGGEWEEGKEYDLETKMQKDRDGFDELWIVTSRMGGRTFAPRNMFPEAYTVAMKWMEIRNEEMSPEKLDTWALYFKEKFWTMNAPIQTSQNTPQLPDAQLHPEEKTININDIPF